MFMHSAQSTSNRALHRQQTVNVTAVTAQFSVSPMSAHCTELHKASV